jgi:hypothetical protein
MKVREQKRIKAFLGGQNWVVAAITAACQAGFGFRRI